MKFEIRQKLLCFGDDFAVKDEFGRDCFYFDGKAMSIGKKIEVLNEQKKEVATINQQLFAFVPTYHLKRHGRVVGTIRKKRMTFRPQFVLDVPGADDYSVIGDFVGHEYTVKRGSRDVARISKRFFGATDSYGVELQGGDALLILSVVVVIDLILHQGKKS